MVGVEVPSVAVTPADPSKVFAATFAGLMRSSDRGVTWTNLSPPFSIAYRVAVSPSNANVVYTDSPQGLRMSTDGGLTFAPAGTGLGAGPVTALRVDPQIPATVDASLNSGDALYKSVDAGAHWSAANTGLSGETIRWRSIRPMAPPSMPPVKAASTSRPTAEDRGVR